MPKHADRNIGVNRGGTGGLGAPMSTIQQIWSVSKLYIVQLTHYASKYDIFPRRKLEHFSFSEKKSDFSRPPLELQI